MRQSLDSLEVYYKSLEYQPDLFSPKDVFPHMASFQPRGQGDHDNLVRVNFQYVLRLHKERLLFLAKADGDRLIIKFTQQYSLDAHQLLSDHGYAPKLLGFESVPGVGTWLL